jgi:hypothetical protein
LERDQISVSKRPGSRWRHAGIPWAFRRPRGHRAGLEHRSRPRFPGVRAGRARQRRTVSAHAGHAACAGAEPARLVAAMQWRAARWPFNQSATAGSFRPRTSAQGTGAIRMQRSR